MDNTVPCQSKGSIDDIKLPSGKKTNSKRNFGRAEVNKNHQRIFDSAIGIDLGTKHCCVAVLSNNKITIIQNKTNGKNTTPNYISFEANGSITIGQNAKTEAFDNPEFTIFDSKRMIGRTVSDPNLQRALKNWPFKVATSEKQLPQICVREGLLSPEKISSILVKHCVDLAEKQLLSKVTKAVITIPAYFTENQKQATKEAGRLAGLKTIHLLPEPTAAAIAYKENRVYDDAKRVLVFDLGAGTLDIAVVDINGQTIEIRGTGGDAFLGGDDFDDILIDYCIESCNKKHSIDIREPQPDNKHLRSLSRIREECERKKIDLSNSSNVRILVDSVFPDVDMDVNITRDKYEELIQPLVDRLMTTVSETLAEKSILKEEIEDIVLVGASTLTPKIQEALECFFDGKSVNTSINRDDAVAYGAAVHGACLYSKEAKKTYGIELSQIVTISFGVECILGNNYNHFVPIIKKGIGYPVTKTIEFQTHEDDQDQATIRVYQGENSLTTNNVFIGKFDLLGIPKNKAREEKITVSMQLDGNGLLLVRATCINGLSSNHVEIKVTRN